MMRPDPDRPTGPRACPPGRRRASTLAAGLLAFAGLAANGAAVTDVDVVSDPGTYTPVGTPDEILVEVTFDDPVAVSGSPTFVLMVGDQRKSMSYVDGAATATLQFAYTVQVGDLDLDGVSHPANALLGRITDHGDGEVADTAFRAARYDRHLVDGVAPRIVGNAQVMSNPEQAGTYAPGETIDIRLRFDEALDTDAATELELLFDGREVLAQAPATTGSDMLDFDYTVQDGDLDGNGFAIRRQAITVTDEHGNSADRTVTSVQTQQKVDGVPPEVLGTPRIVSRPQRGNTYAAEEEIEIEVRFSEPVYGAAGASFSLQIGAGEPRSAAYAAGNRTQRLRFSYEVSVGDRDADGISWAEDALNADDITDIVDQPLVSTDVDAVAAQTAHRVDAGVDDKQPVVTGVAIVSAPDMARTYATGQEIIVGVTFSEAVVVAGSPEPTLTLSLGAGTAEATFDMDSSGTAQLLFVYPVADGDEDRNGVGVGPIADTLVGGTIRDRAGNTAVREFRALPDQSAHRVDGVPPTVQSATVTSEPESGETFRAGDPIDVTVRFSEAVRAVHTPDLGLELMIGDQTRRAHLESGNGTRSLVFRYLVRHHDEDADGVSLSDPAFVRGRLSDLPGNELPSQAGLQLSGDRPRVDASTAFVAVAIVSDPGNDNVYTAGDTIEFEASFGDETIRVSGTPELVLRLGPRDGPKVDRRAQLVRQRPTLLAFSYRVQAGDRDDDGVSVAEDALMGGAITDQAGNPFRSVAPLADGASMSGEPAGDGHRVDGIAPSATAIQITSNAGGDRTYGRDDAIVFALTFTESVHLDDGELALAVEVGGTIRLAALRDGLGTSTLHFRYEVAADDRDADGVSVPVGALRCNGGSELEPCGFHDAAGNAVEQPLLSIPAAPQHRVDGRVAQPRLELVSEPDNANRYRAGEHIEVALAFPVTVHVRGDPGLPELLLSVGGEERRAGFVAGSGTDTLRFRYTVAPGDNDDDGVSVGPGPGSLVGGDIVDDGDLEVPRTFAALGPSRDHRVDAVVPTAASVEIVSMPPDNDGYGLGESIEAHVVFTEPVFATGVEALALVIEIGPRSRRAAYVDGSGTDTFRFAYRIVATDRDDDGVSIGREAMVGGVITDVAGNPWGADERRIPPVPPDDTQKVDSTIDRVAPSVDRIEIVSTPVGSTYLEDEVIEVEATFSEPVEVMGAPVLRLSVGSKARDAAFAAGEGTATLTFRYVVQPDDFDDDGISVGPGRASLADGVIEDAAGNQATRDFEGLLADPRHTVNVGVVAPVTVAEVRIVSPEGEYGVGDAIEVAVEFSDVVHVTGEPVLALSIGANTREAAFAAGSGTPRLLFRYTVVAGDEDDDGISIAADALQGGTITDSRGVAVTRASPAVPQDPDHTVDTTAASLVRVAIVSSPGGDSIYGADDTITVAATFDEPVHVTGRPTLGLSIGARVRDAGYATGSGTPRLLFRYTVVAGDEDDDGISIAANALVGGGIAGRGGIPAVRDFEAVGPFPRHRVCTAECIVVPMVASVAVSSDAGDDAAYFPGDVIEIAVGFSDVVHVTGDPVLALRIGANTRLATFAAGSGTERLLFRYTVVAGDEDDDGISIAANALAGGRIESGSGIPAVRDFEAVGPFPRHRVATTVPTVDSVAVSSDAGDDAVYTAGDVIEVAVEFSEVVHVTGDPVLALRIGADTRQAAFAAGSGTERLLFRYTVLEDDEDDDGISIAANALAGGRIESGSGIVAVRDFEAVGPFPRHRVATAVPTVDSVAVSSDAGDDAVYTAGDVIEVAVEFSEVVHVTGDPVLALRIGADTRQAAFAAGSGTEKLLFRYTVLDGDEDDDGISIATNALAGGRIESGSGIPAVRDFEAVGPFPRHRVATTVPTVDSVAVSSDAGDDAVYTAGDVIEVAVEFSEVVHVTGDPVLALRIGADTRQAAFAAGSGTERLLFRYTVLEDDEDDDGISIAANALAGGRIESGSGIVAVRDFEAVGPFPRHRVATAVPTVDSVAVSSDAGDDAVYTAGDVIEVAVEFSEVAHVTGDPVLALRIGADTRQAAFAAGSGTEKLLFRYTVVDGDEDDDGISIATNALTGGGIAGRGGIPAVRDFEAVGPFPLHRVHTAVPTVASVDVSSDAGEDAVYTAGDVIEVAVEFTDVVHVTGDPVLALRIGANTRQAAFAAGSGTDTLLFRYTVVDGDEDDDGISIATNALTGGGIAGRSGIPAARDFEALGPFPLHGVDTAVPMVASITISSDAGADTAYLPGDVIEVAVGFNDVVHVTGDPVLALSIGANTRQAAFATGSGTERLLFRYTVVDGDEDEDGISIAADALTGGQIESGSGNAADRAFAAVEAQQEHRVLNSVELAFAPLDATVGSDQTIDLAAALATAGIGYAGGFAAVSDAPSVVEVGTMANLLTVTPRQEGTATVTITAVQAPITLFLAVTVTASAEETAILESSLAAVGRALLSSVSATVGTRLESPDAASGSAAQGFAPPSGWRRDGLLVPPSRDPLDPWSPDALAGGRDQGYRLPPQAFAMQFSAVGDARGWALWGALDVQSFSGEPETGSYDGSLESLHIGADVRGDGWVAGASASRSTAEVSYDLAGDEARSGTLETELNAVYPYVRWTPADGTIVWTVLGLGTGEAYHGRDGPGVAPVPDAPGQLSMRLGMAGLKTRLGVIGGVSLALRSDAGFVRLDTDDGLPAAQGLAAAAQRVRAGVEASVPVATDGGATLTPFLDLGGRWDGGDGDTGGGAELAAGIRVKGPMGGVELKARSLVVSGTEGQAETGVSATAYLTPGANRAGWRLALSPRWGDATARDVMWQSGAALRRAGRRASAPSWTVGGEIGRGFELRDRSALVTPFGEFDLGRDDDARRRIGVRYERNDTGFSVPLRVELSGERVAQPGRGADNRVLITAEARR